MALTLTTGARNAAANAVVDLIDVGSADATGDIVIGTTGMGSTLVTLTFSNPAFGNAATGVATASAITTGTCVAAGTAAEAKLRDRDNADVITGLTVGTSGSNINLSSLAFNISDTVAISSMTWTQPAS
jgi:hypothetical protein